MQHYRERAAQLGAEEHDFPDFEELWYFEARTDVGEWLLEHGWDVSVLTNRPDQRQQQCARSPRQGCRTVLQ
jgi:O-methyltransferase involved in polyketide biosynthesis